MDFRLFAYSSIGPLAIVYSFTKSIYKVAGGREKYNIKHPATTGKNEDFDRIFRGFMNGVEYFAPVITLHYITAFTTSAFLPYGPAAANILAIVYAVSRVQYVNAYAEATAKRTGPFGRIVHVLRLYLLLAFLGIAYHVVYVDLMGSKLPAPIANLIK
eukprot:Clim_evm28s204 gene=Clim_evmTU28s204